MIDTGIYNPFAFVDNLDDIRRDVVLKVGSANMWIFHEASQVQIVSLATGTVVNTGTVLTWDYKGETMSAVRVVFAPIAGVKYYVVVDNVYYSDVVFERSDCRLRITTSNSCANQYYDFATFGTYFIYLPETQQAKSEFQNEETIIITDKGAKRNVTSLVERHRVQFVAPISFEKYLQTLKVNDTVSINQPVKNIEIEVTEQAGGAYGLFTLSYQYADLFEDAKGCCDVLNIDDILNPEIPSGGEVCALFSAEVVNTAGTLSATLTNAPAGTPTYKWYRNGIFLTTSPTIAVTTPGNYRVDVKVSVCSVSASYFLDNPCNLFSLTLTNVNNEINGTVSNIPPGETVTYSVVRNGIEVSTSLPYTALESGNYYVYATAGDCEKVAGIFVNLVDSDCDYTLSITDNGTELEAVTDAGTPVYQWEFEDGDSRDVIGSAATVPVSGKGIYWLTVTNGGCSKETYLYKEPLAETGVFVRIGGTGTTFSIVGINLLNITNFAAEIRVTVNGVVFGYVAGTPTLPNTYGVNGSGQILVPFSLTNPTIIVELI